MIGVIFQSGGEIIETRIEGNNILFRSSSYGAGFAPIEKLNISKEGAIKEFPDLENDPLWRIKAIQRFKNEIKKLKTEDSIANYLIDDLKKYGYIPKYKQKQGYRPEVING